jgi:pyrimidine-nucleoside phosphorylase
MLRMVDIIEKKRDGEKLTRKEIRFFIKGVVEGSIPDYQASALLMAICLNGMDEDETLELTMAMVDSGETVDLSSIHGIKVDKHSTGGVGDKTTIILGPIVAACGVPVAKMSGRGLGHTGGTIDKLESIPGFNTDFNRDEFINIVKDIGLAVVGQTGNLVPADKKLYALRDVTGTIQSVPLIASSIMSKKLAAGADAIVLDVKVGSGAFMKTLEDAKRLAKAMVKIGNGAGRKTTAVITDMEVPLGNAIGNALEVKEAIEVLSGRGSKDITEICITLAAKMLELGGKGSYENCRKLAADAIARGHALNKLKQMIKAQHGNVNVADNTGLLPKASHIRPYPAPKDGYIKSMVSDRLGKASMLLGAGRATKESIIDPASGIILLKKPGEKVNKGENLMLLHTNHVSLYEAAFNDLDKAIEISQDMPEERPLIIDCIS